MAKEICISSTPHETRLAILEDDQVTEVYYERENEYTLAGSIYKGRVTRVLPGMQSAFVDVGLERDAFLYVTDFLEEAGESADFERMGTQPARTENSNKLREPREGRQRSEARPGRSQAPQPDPRPDSRSDHRSDPPSDQRPEHHPESSQHAIELTLSPPLPQEGREQEGRDEETDSTGTRRWRGRRGRRRSGGRPATPRPVAPGETAQVASAVQPGGLQFESVESIDMLPYDDTIPLMEASVSPEAEPHRQQGEFKRETGRRAVQESGATISLPGESLSKYGTKLAQSAAGNASDVDRTAASSSAAAQKTNYVAPKPKTLVDAPALADGGSLLAGESISKYRRPAAAAAAVPLEFSEPLVESTQEPALPAAPEEWTPVASSAEASTQEIAAADDHLAEARISSTQASLETTESLPEPTPPIERELHELHAVAATDALQVQKGREAELHETELQQAELHETGQHDADPQEPEPADASASHKVDPSAPSEFRLPWFSDKTKAKESVTGALPETPAVEKTAPDESPEPSTSHPSTPHHPEHAHGVFDDALAAASESYESEVIHHEAELAEIGAEKAPGGFAPGAGVLEEEIIDEEEYDFAPLHAHSDEHEHDELEEETLDQQMGGAELGEMVREAALDQRINIPFGSVVSSDEEEEEGVEESAADLAEAEAYGDETSEEPAAAEGVVAPSRRVDESRRGGRGRQARRGRNGAPSGGGRGRQNTQSSDLPVISDLLKQGQEILVQIAKEPIAKKGARITSHIALPGRFLVFMPTVNHVGVSRKISSDEERQRLKRILISEKGDAVGGFIVRTAATAASEEDLRADIRFLLSLWTGIKERSDTAKAPALIYHDLNLVERVLRDQVSDNFSSIWVDNEVEYERIVRFLQRFQPSLVRRVKLYTKETPLFEQFGIQEEITKALKSKVWLKSGGSIVINQTEALVAIDINTGKYVGKTTRLEDTILKTNLDAIPEIVRQIRLRDLGGIIVIDFIDMDERKNRHRVMLAMEEALKADRAPSKVLPFNDFGLIVITRKRVKQSLERTLSVQCEVCTGTGMVKSPTTVCNEIYTEMRKMHRTFETPDVLLRVNPEVVKTLKGSGARWLTEMEEMISKNIIVKSDPALHPEQFDIH